MLDPELEGHPDVNTRPDFDTRLSRLDAEHKEEFGRFTRLLIGLSAGAVTIVSAILTKGTTAGLLTWSLVFHLISLCCGLVLHFLATREPAVQRRSQVEDLQRLLKIQVPISMGDLHRIQRETGPRKRELASIPLRPYRPGEKTAIHVFQIGSFAVASLLLFFYFVR